MRSVRSGELRQSAGKAGPQDARIGTSKEPPGAQAEAGQAVSVTVGNALDHAVETKAAKLVSHPALCQVIRSYAKQWRQIFPEVSV